MVVVVKTINIERIIRLRVNKVMRDVGERLVIGFRRHHAQEHLTARFQS
jgi:hypothetical protein